MNLIFSKVKCIALLAGLVLSLLCPPAAMAQKQATWIWYPGDYEVWLSNNMQNRRTERGAFFPPFWRQDNHYVLMDFHRVYDLAQPEEIELYAEGQYNVKLDSKMLPGTPTRLTIPAGKHKINIKVHAQDRVPAIFVKGPTIVSDSSWLVTYEDKEWIDETGKVSGQSGTTWLKAGSWNFNDPNNRPSAFKLATEPWKAVDISRDAGGMVVDFGKETSRVASLERLQGKGKQSHYNGHSREEAMATETSETLDHLEVNQPQAKDLVLQGSRAFRYVNIRFDQGVKASGVSMLYEYLPVADRGKFRCNDDEINKIWDVAAYTLHLNTREFFIDGIKRDRWIWSGDAYQSYLMNYYLLFDSPSVTRTLLALRGKDPVTSHLNTIMDYTFYWFLGINDYYQYTGDKHFIRQFYPRMQSLMEFALNRRNKNGMVEGLAGDWVFIDWADGLSKQGEVSFEQLLLCRSLETMATCAEVAADQAGAARYRQLAADLKTRIFETYWDAGKHALVHSRVNGVPTQNVTRYANMFAIFFDYLNAGQKQEVRQHVLLNDQVQKITTPYMRFYELEALAAMGEQTYVLKEMKDYWGGMLRLGATSFWEKYDPAETGAQHYAMYGRPFGRSLCHAWGASPIYLLGKYYLGVKPTTPAYSTYLVEPQLGGLQWMEGTVPTPKGQVQLYCSTTRIRVKGDEGTGTLRFKSKSKPSVKGARVAAKGNNLYELSLAPGKQSTVTYKAM